MEANEKSRDNAFTATVKVEKEDKDEKMKVSSTAIVKYEAQLSILPYAKLRQDTDLNIAPENWLRDGRFSNAFPTNRNPLEFSSFGIAHTFLDTIGDVDVISDAENIKKLLKMAYSKAELSLVVHRIGKTLLLDELDLPGIFTFVSQTKNPSGLRWLYDFYCEERGIPKDSDFKKKKNKHEAKQKNIFSKFLHYSIQQDQDGHADSSSFSEPSTTSESQHHIPVRSPGNENKFPAETEETSLKNNEKCQGKEPEPIPETERFSSGTSPSCTEKLNVFPEEYKEDALPEPQQMSSFQRNLLWKFEDLHMLVGSNVPIFGGGKYPAVSLRLRDCGKPINVLTGLDYWLDNLMCNVPEVAMCYHLDGLVQYYDLFKTEDLPHLEGSSFSPKVVKDIAQNVLSFMKSNCTQEGHTYWLFKASDSEVVKLYDLTSICDQNAEKYQNPFTVPVAMLFYRVAKNMMKQESLDAGDQSIVKLLLDSCMGLLNNQQFPEIITSANILLSKLYCPDNIHTMSSLDKTSDSKHASQEDLTPEYHEIQTTPVDDMAYKGSLEVRELSTPGMYQDDIRQIAETITNNVEIRCRKGLSFIVEGLRCLKLGLASDEEAVEMDNITNKDDRCHGNSPPSGPQARSGHQSYSVRRLSALEPSSSRPSLSRGSEDYNQNPLLLVKPVHWRAQSKALLIRKATSVYHSMACLANMKGKFGRGLRFSKLSLECFDAYKSCGTNKYEEDNELMRSILCACADSYLMLAKCVENLEVHRDEFMQRSHDDKMISIAAKEFVCKETLMIKVDFKSVVEDSLITSADFYEAALNLTGKQMKEDEYVSLARRAGNVKNELGVYFMNRAAVMIGNGDLEEQRKMWKKSVLYFESGVKAFETINDKANLALLHSNTGRLMRLCAQAVRADKPSQGEFSLEEKNFYKQAIEFYNRALQSLTERKVCMEVWDAVTWELCGAYFTMATLLQDFPPLSILAQQEVEKEIIELMMKALKICEPTGRQQAMTSHRPQSSEDLDRRLGSIHHRLASLYHNAYRNETVDQSIKKIRSLAELHYSKACTYFKASTFPCEWIRIHLERVALCEHQIKLYSSASSPVIKILYTALEFIIDSGKALIFLTRDENKADSPGKDKPREEKVSEYVKGKDDKQGELKSNDSETMKDTADENEGFTSEHLKELKYLISILEGRLNHILKEIVKFWNTKRGKNRDINTNELEKAKRMYSLALRRSVGEKDRENCVQKGLNLSETLGKIKNIKGES